MLTLQSATRAKSITQLLAGGLILVVAVVGRTPERMLQGWGVGYFIGGGFILIGIWGWFSAVENGKRAQAAEARGRMTAADYAGTGIPDTAPSTRGFLTVVAIMLMIGGVLTFPVGLLFVAGGAALWWHARREQAARVAQGEARFFPHQPDPVIGGELRGEILLPGDLQVTGPARVSFSCQRRTRVARRKKPDRIESDTLAEAVQRLLAPEDWKPASGGRAAAITLPVRGGAPSAGSVPPSTAGASSIIWLLTVTLPVNGKERTLEFIVPVAGQTERPELLGIPPEIAAAASDLLAPGNPGKVAAFLADQVVQTPEIASVAPAEMAAILAAAGIKEVPKYGAVGGHGLQMDPGASQAAHGFMTGGIGCAVVVYAFIGLVALPFLLIPYVGWLITLAAFGLIIWALRSNLADKAKLTRSPELLWVEPGQFCYMADGVTEWRVPLAEVDRVEVQWLGSVGAEKYVRISLAKAPEGGTTKRERDLLAHGVRGSEAARAVVTWLLQKLGASRPVVETQQGQDQFESLRNWIKDPVKR